MKSSDNPTFNYRWKILDKEKAKKLHIEVVEIDKDIFILSLDMSYKPKKVKDFLSYVQEKNIVVNAVKN